MSIFIKRGEFVEGLHDFVRKDRIVKAKQMGVTFVVETGKGWDPSGKPGDWLVLVGDDLWMPVENEQFNKIYKPIQATDCIGPCPEIGADRRTGDRDRRVG